MKKITYQPLLKAVFLWLLWTFSFGLSQAQTNDFEHLAVREYKGDVVRIEERKYYQEKIDGPYLLSDTEVFRYHNSKLMDAYQKINRADANRTFRKFIYNDQGLLHTVEVSANGSNEGTQKLVFFYDANGNAVKIEKHRDRKVSFVSYQYDSNSKMVQKSRTNERGTTYQIETLTYDKEGRLSTWRSDDQVMKSKSTKNYSYARDNGFLTTTIEIEEFTGAKSIEYITTNSLGHEVIFNEKMTNGLLYESSKVYLLDDNSNWIRRERLTSNTRKGYTLRRITYADGTVTGRLESMPDDAFVKWRSSGASMEIQVDGKNIRNSVKSVYLHGSPDVLAYDFSRGLSFIMEGYKNDSSYKWKPALAVRTNNDLYWKISDEGFHVYYKGTPSSVSVSLLVNDDVILYLPSAHQSFLLKDYKANSNGKLHAAETMSLGTNAFWFKTEGDSFRLVINGAYAGGTLPNKWLNSKDLIINDEAGNPRFALKGYADAKVGEIYPATSY